MRTESRTRQQDRPAGRRAGQPGQRGARPASDAGLPPGWALQAAPRRPRSAAPAAEPVTAPAGRPASGRQPRPAGAARGAAAPARDGRSRDPQAAGPPAPDTGSATRTTASGRATAPGRAGRGDQAGPGQRRPAPSRTAPSRPGRSRLRAPAPASPQQLRPGSGQPAASPAAPARPAAGTGTVRLPGGRRLGGPRTPFVLLVLGLLGGGLVCLLVINTTLAAASFQITHLKQGNATLSQQQQALQQEIAKEQAPATIARRAYQLGMRQQQHLTFLNARTGHIYRAPLKLAGVTYAPPGYTP